MRLDDKYPDPRDLRDVEIRTLQYVANNKIIDERYKAFSKKAGEALTYLKQIQKKIDKKQLRPRPVLSFDAFLDSEIQKRNVRVVFGGSVDATHDDTKYEKYTYYLALVHYENAKPKLLRKFHFDYTPTRTRNRRSQPAFHLQYGGGSPDMLKEIGVSKEQLDDICPWLEVPRMTFMPMTLALLLQMVFQELLDEELSQKLVSDKEWRDILAANEKLCLENYYTWCRSLSGKKTPRKKKGKTPAKPLICDLLYGKEC